MTNPYKTPEDWAAAIEAAKQPIDRPARLFFTMGTPRGGKSTYCTRWAQHLEMPSLDSLPRSIVCADSIRLALHGDRYKSESEPMIFTLDTYFIRALLIRGMDVIVDETNTTERAIRRVLEIDTDAQAIVIDTPVETCIERAYATNQPDLVPVIERVSRQLERLSLYGVARAVENIRDAVKTRNFKAVLPW